MIGERRLLGREPRLEKMAVDTPEARETRSRVAWARGRRDACNGARERREERKKAKLGAARPRPRQGHGAVGGTGGGAARGRRRRRRTQAQRKRGQKGELGLRGSRPSPVLTQRNQWRAVRSRSTAQSKEGRGGAASWAAGSCRASRPSSCWASRRQARRAASENELGREKKGPRAKFAVWAAKHSKEVLRFSI